MEEYEEEMCVSQSSENSDCEEVRTNPGLVQYPDFPSGQLLDAIKQAVQVGLCTLGAARSVLCPGTPPLATRKLPFARSLSGEGSHDECTMTAVEGLRVELSSLDMYISTALTFPTATHAAVIWMDQGLIH